MVYIVPWFCTHILKSTNPKAKAQDAKRQGLRFHKMLDLWATSSSLGLRPRVIFCNGSEHSVYKSHRRVRYQITALQNSRGTEARGVMAGSDPQKHLFTLIRDYASEKSQGG